MCSFTLHVKSQTVTWIRPAGNRTIRVNQTYSKSHLEQASRAVNELFELLTNPDAATTSVSLSSLIPHLHDLMTAFFSESQFARY